MSKHPSNALVTNRTARRDYHIIDSIETGIELRGTEVKSLRDRRANLTESFARIDDGELVLVNLHISPYDKGNRFNVDPLRPRKLLVHKNEILRLQAQTDEKGMTLIPLKLYLKRGLIKVELGVAKGKFQYDKREDIKKREHSREIEKAVSRVNQRGRRGI
ncbi:SsrA-binding protein SmpB [bacterium]|nr:SsrA-binding protein SmpB [bacterium]